MLLWHAATRCESYDRAPFSEAQPGDSRCNQESGVRFRPGRRAPDSGAGGDFRGVRRVRNSGRRAVPDAAISPGSAGSADRELGMAHRVRVVACRPSRGLPIFGLSGDGHRLGDLSQHRSAADAGSFAVVPDLAAAFAQVFSAPAILALQIFWVALFWYYGRSRVTASTLSFHVVADRI